MLRDVIDAEGVTLFCTQAFAALGNDPAKTEAACVEGKPDRVYMVCTPSGGARPAWIELRQGWQRDCADDNILTAIRAAAA